jgi:hypothetical protein
MSQGIEDLKEEIKILQARVEELERKQPRPIPNEWMFTCKAPKCGCEGDPRWHADKAAAQRAAQGPSPYDPVTIKRARASRGTGCPHKPAYRNCWCGS